MYVHCIYSWQHLNILMFSPWEYGWYLYEDYFVDKHKSLFSFLCICGISANNFLHFSGIIALICCYKKKKEIIWKYRITYYCGSHFKSASSYPGWHKLVWKYIQKIYFYLNALNFTWQKDSTVIIVIDNITNNSYNMTLAASAKGV